MTRILVRKQLAEIFRTYFYDAKKNKARSKGAVIAYFILFAFIMVGLLGGMFTFVSILLRGTIASGYGWFYYLMLALVAICLGAFGSVFNTFSGLYLSRDNDLLLSMPIPVRSIMVSRLLTPISATPFRRHSRSPTRRPTSCTVISGSMSTDYAR